MKYNSKLLLSYTSRIGGKCKVDLQLHCTWIIQYVCISTFLTKWQVINLKCFSPNS